MWSLAADLIIHIVYTQSLAADHVQLLVEGRKTFPDLFHKLQVQRYPPPLQEEEDIEQPGPSGEGQSLRRSRRARKRKKNEVEEPENTDPFCLSGQPAGSSSFCQWQKQRDYELLEWLAKMHDVDVDLQLSAEVSMDEEIPAASSVEVGSAGGMVSTAAGNQSSEVTVDADLPVIGRGMRLVHDSIQQAMEESEAERNKDAASSSGNVLVNGNSGGGDADNVGDSSEHQVLTSGGGDAFNTVVVNGENPQTGMRSTSSRGGDDTSSSSQSASTRLPNHHQSQHTALSGSVSFGSQPPAARVTAGASRGSNPSEHRSSTDPQRQLPNLPPTSTSILSFKHLLLRRLGLIKTAGKSGRDGVSSLAWPRSEPDQIPNNSMSAYLSGRYCNLSFYLAVDFINTGILFALARMCGLKQTVNSPLPGLLSAIVFLLP